MDNLRALAMLAGVLFHAGLAYSVLLHGFWPTADVHPSVIVDIVAWFSHLFRMPLFFLVAGFFTALLVAKRGVYGMLRNRFARVLLPFILFWPVVYAAMTWLTVHAANNVEHLSPLLVLVKTWMADPTPPRAPPTLMHLWFLPYLMCFCVLVWVSATLEWTWPSRSLASAHPILLLAFAPLMLVPALASVAAPFPAPESVFPQWWALLFFGFYFAFGYQLFRHPTLIAEFDGKVHLIAIAAIAAYVIFFCLLQMRDLHQPKPLLHWLQATQEAYSGFWFTICALAYGKQWLNQNNRFLRYVADASYWVYLIHLPILFAIQYRLLDVELGMPTKFSIATALTLGISFASYHFLVRGTVVGGLLHGKRRYSTHELQLSR